MSHVTAPESTAETPVARAVRIASEAAGSQAALGVAVGVKGASPKGVVWAWISRGRVPTEYCQAVKRIGGDGCHLWDMRPEDWHRIWPELIGTEGAPDVPSAIAADASPAAASKPTDRATASHKTQDRRTQDRRHDARRVSDRPTAGGRRG